MRATLHHDKAFKSIAACLTMDQHLSQPLFPIISPRRGPAPVVQHAHEGL